jgi:4,5-DOPA dioxygenase extradiol
MQEIPAAFIGHGSPFNLFSENPFTNTLKVYGKEFFQKYNPEAIVLISAHWSTKGTFVTADANPKMIYDYYGFPQKFYDYTYPARGSPEISSKISNFLSEVIGTTLEWGIDHAATIILENILPDGNIPVIELSLDINQSLEYHYELGKKLTPLRKKGIFFIGSGNLIHTFRELEHRLDATPFDWAIELDKIQKTAIDTEDLEILLNQMKASFDKRGFQTLEHYIPMLYILGMKQSSENVRYIFEGIQNGSISHRSFEINS